MINILLTGVGGQGTVLAAKVLAMAAASKGWHVRTAETIGMAQRGGSVISHVRMGNLGEEVYAPLITHGTANMIVAFEPAEAARTLSFLAPDGVVVTAQSTVEPVSAALDALSYTSENVLSGIQRTFYNRRAHEMLHAGERETAASAASPSSSAAPAAAADIGHGAPAASQTTAKKNTIPARQRSRQRLISVDDKAVTDALGGNRKILNSVLLAVAVSQNNIPLTIHDLRTAIAACVKPQFVAMNLTAIDTIAQELGEMR